MKKYEEAILDKLTYDRDHAIKILRRLQNRQFRLYDAKNKTSWSFAAALGLALKVIWANEHNVIIPKLKRRVIEKHLETLDCLYAFADCMYLGRKADPLLMFLSHEDHVRALELATKEARKYLEKI